MMGKGLVIAVILLALTPTGPIARADDSPPTPGEALKGLFEALSRTYSAQHLLNLLDELAKKAPTAKVSLPEEWHHLTTSACASDIATALRTRPSSKVDKRFIDGLSAPLLRKLVANTDAALKKVESENTPLPPPVKKDDEVAGRKTSRPPEPRTKPEPPLPTPKGGRLADGHDESVAPPRSEERRTEPRRVEAPREASVDTLKKWVTGEAADGVHPAAGDEKWWDATAKLLDTWKIDEEDGERKAEAFRSSLEGRARELFGKAIKARFAPNAERLRDWAYGSADADLQEASEREIRHRLNDPNVKFVQKYFHVSDEKAMVFADEMRKAKSDPKAGIVFARKLGNIGIDDRQALLKAATKNETEVAKAGLDTKLVERLREAAAVSLEETHPDRNLFTQAFHDEYQKVLAENRHFWAVARAASRGDEDAKKELKQYDPELYNSIMARKGTLGDDGAMVTMLRAPAKKILVRDEEGKEREELILELSAHDLDYKGKAPNQILRLGRADNPAENKAAFLAFHTGGPLTRHDLDTGTPAPESRFLLYRLGLNAGEGTPSHFFAKATADEEKPELAESEATGLPEGSHFASLSLQHPDSAPAEAAKRREVTAREKDAEPEAKPRQHQTRPAPPTDPDHVEHTSTEDREKAAQVQALCLKCHGTAHHGKFKGNYHFTEGLLHSKKGLERILKAIKDEGMPADNLDFLDQPEGQALQKWLREKTGVAAANR